jgi:hypothetical protein
MTMGSAMAIVAHVFPSLFPATSADLSSSRVLWLYVMATTQVAIGLGYVVQANVFPLAARLILAVRGSETGSLALPKARGFVGR